MPLVIDDDSMEINYNSMEVNDKEKRKKIETKIEHVNNDTDTNH